MNYSKMVRSSLFMLVLGLELVAQHPTAQGEAPDHFGFDKQDWTAIESRWMECQPATIAYLKSGEIVSGQQIFTNEDSIYLYPFTGLPIGPQWKGHLIVIHVNDIDSLLFQKGGNKMTRSKQAESYLFPVPDARFSEPHLLLRKESVYSDTLVYPHQLDRAIKYSTVLRHAFPQKRIRISFGLGFGGDVVTEDILEMLGGTSLPYPHDSYGGSNVSAELLDLSVRFRDRIIVGGQLLARQIESGVYSYSYNSMREVNYSYSLNFREHRIYGEYAILHTDRYFLRRFEVLAGVGLLISKPEIRFSYSHYNTEDFDNVYGGNWYYNYEDLLLGAQLKATIHYYIIRGLSIWTGLEANLYPTFIVPAQEISVSGIEDTILLPEHGLNFSCVRFKLGISLYF